MANSHNNTQSTPSQFQMAQIPLAAFFDNNECKALLNAMSMRLNDMDLKLTLILELLAARLPDQRIPSIFTSPPQTVISEAPPQSFTPSATNSTSDKTTSSLKTELKTEDSDGDLDMEGEEDTEELFENESQPSQRNLSPKETEVEDEKVLADGPFPEGAVKRAAEKAARSFQSTQPKIRLVVEATMKYFKWNLLSTESQLSKAKLILSHLKNNAKVRNWTLREGRPNRVAPSTPPVNVDLVWKRYLSLLGPANFAGLLPNLSQNLCNGNTQTPSLPPFDPNLFKGEQ
uniref:Homeobox domain-containing protein n=1 Tax=Caenorhabditis tropicalis TaxID=1561998 RepID=A0A1I7TLI8_9PELO